MELLVPFALQKKVSHFDGSIAIFDSLWIYILQKLDRVLSGYSPRWENLPRGYHNYLLKGINLRSMYCGKKHFSE